MGNVLTAQSVAWAYLSGEALWFLGGSGALAQWAKAQTNSWGSGEGGCAGGDHNHCPPMTFGGHIGMKIAGHEVSRLGLARAPFHEEAVGQTAKDAQHVHGIGMSDAGTVVVLGHVQPLVQAVFDAAEAGAIKPQPSLGVQLGRRRAGQQGDGLRLAASSETVNPGYLCGGWKTDGLRSGRGRAEDADFIPAAIALLGAGARARRCLRGGRLPQSPAAAFLSSREFQVGCL